MIYLPFSSTGGEGEKKDHGDLTRYVAMLLPIEQNSLSQAISITLVRGLTSCETTPAFQGQIPT